MRELLKEGFFILADGMGGHNSGEIASSKTIEYVCASIQKLFSSHSLGGLEEMLSYLSSTIENANLWIKHLGHINPKHQGMGCTLCSILFFQDSLIRAHVGDSRIYLIRQNQLILLTKDHIISEDPKSSNHSHGLNKKEHIFNNVPNQKKRLTKAIGTSLFITPELHIHKVKVNDLYLMCSDGLTDLVSDSLIEKIIIKNYYQLKNAGEALIEAAKKNGGHDNITLLLARTY